MTGSPQPPTTKSGLDETGRFLSGSQHPDWKDLLEPEWENAQFGSWTVVSRSIQRRGKHIYAQVRCGCGTEAWKVRALLEGGMDANDVPFYTRIGLRMSTISRTPDPAIVSLYRGA